MDKKLGIAVFTTIEWICVLLAAWYTLTEPHNHVYFNALGAIMYLVSAGICEWIKYHINNNNHEGTKVS